ncbi:MAG TPA: hypothetical protein VF131_27765 [Blastocatellia bacterium]|nr:hypothetical protein [Blastocatellia bacterium]
MKGIITNRQIIRCSLVVLLIGLAAGRANAQENRHIELLSYSFGVIQGQKARITIILPRLANPHPPQNPVNAHIQLLDTEGDVIAQSGELRLLLGQTRSWDQPRALLPASGEPGERIQLRVRVLVTTLSGDVGRPSLMPAIEVIDTLTGETVYHMGKRFIIFVSGPNGTRPN